MKRQILHCIMLIIMLLPLTDLPAQDSRGKGRLTGDVKDEKGNPIASVEVTLKSLQYNLQLTTASNKKGQWVLFGFAMGQYDLMIQKDGFIPLTLRQPLSGLKANPVQHLVLKESSEEPIANADPNAVPEEHLNWIKTAEAQHKAGQYAQAVETYRQFLAAHPIHYKYQVNVGNCLLELKDHQGAITAFEEALKGLKAEKNDNLTGDKLAADLYSSIGTSWTALGNLSKAAENYKLSAKIAPPTDSALAYNLAEILMAGNDAAGAIEYYNLAIRLDPKDPLYYEKLGYAHLNVGDIPKAIESLNEFIKLAPDNPRAAEIKKLIDALKK